MQFTSAIPMLTTKTKNASWHDSIESRGIHFYYILPRPIIQCWGGGSGKASDKCLGSTLHWGRVVFFSPITIRQTVPTFFLL